MGERWKDDGGLMEDEVSEGEVFSLVRANLCVVKRNSWTWWAQQRERDAASGFWRAVRVSESEIGRV